MIGNLINSIKQKYSEHLDKVIERETYKLDIERERINTEIELTNLKKDVAQAKTISNKATTKERILKRESNKLAL